MNKNFYYLLLTTLLLSACNWNTNGTINTPEILDCDINNNITLSDQNPNGVDYVIDCVLNLTGTLTIEAGTIIEFKSDAGLIIANDGKIEARGIGGNPVIFQGEVPGISNWRGIFVNSENSVSTFDYVEINDAGNGISYSLFSDETAAITLDGNMRMTNSKISNSQGHGIWSTGELYTSNIVEFQNNTIEECSLYPLFIDVNMISKMDVESCSFRENGQNGIAFTEEKGIISAELTFPEIDIPYVFEGDMEVKGKVIIEAGVQVEMGIGTMIRLSNQQAQLTISGSTTNRVSISGKENQAGYWKGILVESSNNNIFENMDISDGGAAATGFNETLANVTLEFEGKLTMIDCTSSRSNSTCDVVIHNFGGMPQFNNMSSDLSVCTE